MRKYGTNSAYAVMRLLAMANIVKKEISENQMRLLSEIAIAQELSQDDILRIVAEYEIDQKGGSGVKKQTAATDALEVSFIGVVDGRC